MAQSLVFLLLVITGLVHNVEAERLCDSIQIGPMDWSGFSKLSQCDVIVGSLTIAKVIVPNDTQTLSPLKEITGYLLVYRTEGIKSLSEIMPNLTIIRGNELLFDEYSFVVYENGDLKNLGLYSLKAIPNGSLRVEKNGVLCYVDTVNWATILSFPTKQKVHFKNNMNPYTCPICKTHDNKIESLNQIFNCWDYNNTQIIRNESETCLRMESNTSCSVCLHLKNSNNQCIDKCYPFIKFAMDRPGVRECMAVEDCSNRPGYYYDRFMCNRGVRPTKDTCIGNITLSTVEQIRELRDCSIINGSITIELTDKYPYIIGVLEQSLENVAHISGYLQIKNSPQLTSLHFFKNLNTIGGEELLPGEVSFYVVNNQHLEELWLMNRKVQFQKGKINFHLNPMLCYAKILALSPQIRSGRSITVDDVSPHSNGEENVCKEEPGEIEVVIENYSSTEARLKVSNFPNFLAMVHLGYTYYYKETERNVSMFQGRSGCMTDDWIVEQSLGVNVRHVIRNLKPYTRYALFVKTFSVTDYHVERNAISKVIYFRTLMGRPGYVSELYFYPFNTTAVIINWWPPKRLNGAIDSYEIHWSENNPQIPDDDDEVIGVNITCDLKFDCGVATKEKKVNLKDESHFTREVLLLDDVLPNYIFYKALGRQTTEKNTEAQLRYSQENFEAPTLSEIGSHDNCQTNISRSPESNEKCKKQKWQKITMYDDSDSQSLSEEKYRQDFGIKGFEIKDGIVDDFIDPSVSATTTPKPSQILQEPNFRIVPGNTHSMVIGGMQSGEQYLISIRACVKENISKTRCGPTLAMHAFPFNINPYSHF